MQEKRLDGSEVLSAGVTVDDILKALENPQNVKVAVFPPGSIIESQGNSYYVKQDGALVAVPKEVAARAKSLQQLREMFQK